MKLSINSLHLRILLSTGLVLTVFFGLAAFALEKGFQRSVEQALKEKLQIRVFSLLSAAELTLDRGLEINEPLPEARFANPDSGLFAYITSPGKGLIWRSISSLGEVLPQSTMIKPGVFEFNRLDSQWYLISYNVIWESHSMQEQRFLIQVVENARFINAEISQFKTTLRSWLLSIGLLSLLTLFFVLRWSLRPLRKMVSDLQLIEDGSLNRLEGNYTEELQGLAANLNALISSERAHATRYRNTLADLAHSLKTPLTVMRGAIKSSPIEQLIHEELDGQITKMNEIVEYQLQRAAGKGKTQFSGTVDLYGVIDKTITSLNKVYFEKQLTIERNMPDNCPIYFEAGDLYEIVGNVLENAFKWCNTKIAISVEISNNKPYSVLICIEDDGPGLANDKIEAILQRGVRADQSKEGHGIGMAVVQELVTLLEGQIEGNRSKKLGGMSWLIRLP